MVENYIPRCPAEDYDASKKNYLCCLNNDEPCKFRNKPLEECPKYLEHILPRKRAFKLEEVA